MEWTEIGLTVLPEQYRDVFLRHLAGEETVGVDYCSTEGETPKWRSPNGQFPMSPGLALKSVCEEWKINPRQVSHNMAWLADDTSGMPGGDPAKHPDFAATYSILGVRTARQTIYLLDGGVSITPLLIVDDGPHERIELNEFRHGEGGKVQ